MTGLAVLTLSAQLLAHALDPNPGLMQYTATAALSAQLHSIVPIRKTLRGYVTYHRPTRRIVFRDVPSALRGFAQMVATTPTYEELTKEYTVVAQRDDGLNTTFEMQPVLPNRRVSKLIVRVGDEAQLVQEAVWMYSNGSRISVKPKYETLQAFQLLDVVTIEARFPGYKVDGVLRFSDYHLGATARP